MSRKRQHCGRPGRERAAHEARQIACTLQTPADVEEAPAVPARHVLHLHAAEGGQVRDHPIELEQRLVELHAAMALTEVLTQLIENAPRVDREPIPDVGCDAPQFFQRLAQTRAGPLPEYRREKLLLHLARRHRRAKTRRHQIE